MGEHVEMVIEMDKDYSDRSSYKRREFLQATSGATFGAAGLEPVSANRNGKNNSVSFVEVGLFHRTALPEVEGNFSFVHLDDSIEHKVSEDEGVLYLNKDADESTKRTFENNDHVSRFVGYSPVPAEIDQRLTRIVTTDIGHASRRTGGLVTAEDYGNPPLSIQTPEKIETDEVVVVSGNERLEVEPGISGSVQLQSRTVRTPIKMPTGEKVQNENVPEPRRAQRIETRVETVTVTPVVKVQNYGQLDVIEVRQ